MYNKQVIRVQGNMKRLIFINTLIFFVILITIESLIFVYRYITNKEPIGYIKDWFFIQSS